MQSLSVKIILLALQLPVSSIDIREPEAKDYVTVGNVKLDRQTTPIHSFLEIRDLNQRRDISSQFL